MVGIRLVPFGIAYLQVRTVSFRECKFVIIPPPKKEKNNNSTAHRTGRSLDFKEKTAWIFFAKETTVCQLNSDPQVMDVPTILSNNPLPTPCFSQKCWPGQGTFEGTHHEVVDPKIYSTFHHLTGQLALFPIGVDWSVTKLPCHGI